MPHNFLNVISDRSALSEGESFQEQTRQSGHLVGRSDISSLIRGTPVPRCVGKGFGRMLYTDIDCDLYAVAGICPNLHFSTNHPPSLHPSMCNPSELRFILIWSSSYTVLTMDKTHTRIIGTNIIPAFYVFQMNADALLYINSRTWWVSTMGFLRKKPIEQHPHAI